MEERSKRYYWLKLKKDFFKQHEIVIVEGMPNGKDYILFYLKLLVESVSHEGLLRFSDTIPYNDTMLANLTNTNIDIVRSAMKIFKELNMIEILDDATIFMLETQKLIGSETQWAEKKRIQRENAKLIEDNSETIRGQIGTMSDKSIETRDKSIDIRSNNSIEGKIKRFKKPSIEEIEEYCREKGYSVDAQRFFDYYESVGWKVGGKSAMKDWKATLRGWQSREKPKNNVPNFENKFKQEEKKKPKETDDEIRKRLLGI